MRESRMASARIDEDRHQGQLIGERLDVGLAILVEVDVDDAAIANADLIEQSAGLAEIFALGKLADYRFVHWRHLAFVVEDVDDFADKGLNRGGRG